ncbi:DUF305 domain-containing protein [Flindersiella endophytica]
MKRALALCAALLAITFAAACGGSSGSDHNQADVDFATGMIPHHAQAVEMADLALEKATNAQVKQLATGIKQAQQPEIDQMSGWLEDWGEEVPATGGEHQGGHTMADGMMSADDMATLENATGKTFDQQWTKLMIEHHQGAITMAKAELSKGGSDDAKQLAQAVIDGQSKEIATMQALQPKL